MAVCDLTNTALAFLASDGGAANFRLASTTQGELVATSAAASQYLLGFATKTSDNTSLVTYGQLKEELEAQHPKESVIVSATSNVDITTLLRSNQLFDSKTLAVGDRVGLFGQTTASENGIYRVRTGAVPVRVDDMSTAAEVPGARVWVTGGANAGYVYQVTSPTVVTGFTLDTTGMTWTRRNDSTSYTGGNGIEISGSSIATDLLSNGGLVFNSGELQVDLGASSLANSLAYSDLATLNTGQLVVGDGGTATARTLGGDATIAANGALTIADNAISSAKIANGAITNDDVNANAAIAYSKLAALATGQIVVGNGGTPTVATMGGDATIAADGQVTIAANAVTSAMIAPGAIVNADINGGAAIAHDKLAALTSGNILVGNGVNVPVSVAMSGDATIVAGGAITLASAQTNVDTMYSTSLIVGSASGQETVDFTTSNEVITTINGSNILRVTATKTFGAGGFQGTSDPRLKTGMQKIERPLEKVLAMKGYRFNWLNPDGSTGAPDYGFNAKEMKDILPEIVHASKTDRFEDELSIGCDNNVNAVLVEAMKDMYELMKEQRREMEELKKQNAKFQYDIAVLKVKVSE